MLIYACTYINTYHTHIHTCIHIYPCVSTYTQICMYTHTYIYIYIIFQSEKRSLFCNRMILFDTKNCQGDHYNCDRHFLTFKSKESHLLLIRKWFSLENSLLLDFTGGAVVKNPSAKAGDMGSSPGLGRSHMPRSN